MYVRGSADGSRWTEWVAVHAEYVVDGEQASDVVFFDERMRMVELSGPARVLFIDPGESAGVPRAAAVAERGAGKPETIGRAQWCPDNACPPPASPSRTTPTHLVVHHTAGANTAADWFAVMPSIWVLHVRGNGWADIGYNFLIDPEGRVYEGRGDGVLGAHFSGVNTGTMGVSLLGTYSTVAAPEAMFPALRSLLVWQADVYGIDAGGRSVHAASGLALNHISGHRDAGLSPRATSTTECPGNAVYARLPELRREVRKMVEGECALEIGEAAACAGAGAETVRLRATAACALDVAAEAEWLTAKAEGGVLEIGVAANAGARRAGTVRVNRRRVSITQAGAGAEGIACVGFDGVRDGAGFGDRPLAQGGLGTLFGTGLAGESAGAGNWPTELGGVQVLVNGRAAGLGFVSDGQINFQLPAVTNIGSATLAVRRAGADAGERLIWVTEAAPAVFGDGNGEALVFSLTGERIGEVTTGGRFAVYLTGAGRSGMPASAALGETALAVVGIENVAGLAGVARAVLEVPAGVSEGAQELTLRIAGVGSAGLRVNVKK